MRFDWSTHKKTGVAEVAFNDTLHKMGGMQLRLWTIKPRFDNKKKVPLDLARANGYRFMEWTVEREATGINSWEWTDEEKIRKSLNQVVHLKVALIKKEHLDM